MSKSLEGLLAIVTGATRGIGAAIAVRLQKEGACVVGTGSQNTGKMPVGCEYCQADFSSEASICKFADMIKQRRPDILINNAGINKAGKFEEIALADFKRIQQINLFAPFVLCQAAVIGMREKKWGRIVNISSIYGKISRAYRAAYSASKFGLDGMTIALAAEFGALNVLANSVAPGFVDTEMTRHMLGEDGIRKMVSQVPVPRLGTVQEIAELVLWLASHQNTFVNGQNIAIDGGYTRV